jgi:hypothetical protein
MKNILAFVIGLIPLPAFGQPSRDDVDRAIDRGLAYLLSQQKENGSILDRGHHTTMSAMAIMAMAATGHQPTDPTAEGKAMKRALQFVLADEHQDANGYFGVHDGSRMYGHGIVTLMLAEMRGMGIDDKMDHQIDSRCQKGIDLILRSQQVKKTNRSKGGWRYTPTSEDSDLSVSVWQLMSLRSAKNDGMDVPSQSIEDAKQYLMRSFTSPLDRDGKPKVPVSGFSYEPQNTHPTFAMTAAGLLAMQVCGDYDSDIVQGATRWLVDNPPKPEDRFFLYGMYYYAQAMHQRGGEIAKNADAIVSKRLLETQHTDGTWNSPSGEEQGIGFVYCTSLAILSLSVKYHYLPIYQR